MRVGLVVCGPLSTESGGFRYDRELLDHLRGEGDTVSIIELPWRSPARALGHNVAPAIRRRLRVHDDVDVMLVDELCAPSLSWASQRIPDHLPLVAIVHHLRASEPAPTPIRWWYRWFERRFLERSDGAVCTSEATRSAVSTLSQSRSTMVAHPGRGRFAPTVDAETVATRAANDGPLRILFVGSIIPRKGVHTLLEGLDRVADSRWKLTVIGDRTADRRYVRRVTRTVRRTDLDSRVTFTGRVSDDELATRLRSGHVLAVPSIYEGFGIAYLEGMGFGVVPIGSSAGGASELIDHGETGFLVAPNRPSEVAHYIRQLATDRDLLTLMAMRCIERYEEHPTWRETMRRVRTYLERMSNV